MKGFIVYWVLMLLVFQIKFHEISYSIQIDVNFPPSILLTDLSIVYCTSDIDS